MEPIVWPLPRSGDARSPRSWSCVAPASRAAPSRALARRRAALDDLAAAPADRRPRHRLQRHRRPRPPSPPPRRPSLDASGVAGARAPWRSRSRIELRVRSAPARRRRLAQVRAASPARYRAGRHGAAPSRPTTTPGTWSRRSALRSIGGADRGLGRCSRPRRHPVGRPRRGPDPRFRACDGLRVPRPGESRGRRRPATSINAFGIDLYKRIAQATRTPTWRRRGSSSRRSASRLALAMARAGAARQ